MVHHDVEAAGEFGKPWTAQCAPLIAPYALLAGATDQRRAIDQGMRLPGALIICRQSQRSLRRAHFQIRLRALWRSSHMTSWQRCRLPGVGKPAWWQRWIERLQQMKLATAGG